jgi:pimeloyl-ACP methyl ester carboxylesterase
MEKKPAYKQPAVIFVPGGVTPAALSYGPLVEVIGNQIRPILKDLELYTPDTPPPGYDVDMEVEGIRRAADAAGLKRFNLVGYSGGSTFALAFTAKYPEYLSSLALVEPAWIGVLGPEDADNVAELNRLMALPANERMQAFMHWHFRPGMQPPPASQPSGPPPAWMAKRPAGLEAMYRAFNRYSLDQDRIRQFNRPVYFAIGSLSNRFFEREAKTLQGLFPDMQIEKYVGRSHFDPPHRAEPERFARAFTGLWARSKEFMMNM